MQYIMQKSGFWNLSWTWFIGVMSFVRNGLLIELFSLFAPLFTFFLGLVSDFCITCTLHYTGMVLSHHRLANSNLESTTRHFLPTRGRILQIRPSFLSWFPLENKKPTLKIFCCLSGWERWDGRESKMERISLDTGGDQQYCVLT